MPAMVSPRKTSSDSSRCRPVAGGVAPASVGFGVVVVWIVVAIVFVRCAARKAVYFAPQIDNYKAITLRHCRFLCGRSPDAALGNLGSLRFADPTIHRRAECKSADFRSLLGTIQTRLNSTLGWTANQLLLVLDVPQHVIQIGDHGPSRLLADKTGQLYVLFHRGIATDRKSAQPGYLPFLQLHIDRDHHDKAVAHV